MIYDPDRLYWWQWAILIAIAAAVVFTLCVGAFVVVGWVAELLQH